MVVEFGNQMPLLNAGTVVVEVVKKVAIFQMSKWRGRLMVNHCLIVVMIIFFVVKGVIKKEAFKLLPP